MAITSEYTTETHPDHVSDRLLAAIERRRAPVCVGLDPVAARLPRAVRPESPGDAVPAIAEFCLAVIEAIAPSVPCLKLQSACFERYRAAGMELLYDLAIAATRRGLIVILDQKRGDIGASAAHYAAAAYGDETGASSADWITVNSYLGADGIEPFLRPGRGAFALVRTSNPGGDAVQALRLEDGRSVAEAVSDLVSGLGDASIGRRGYSSLGAVVGATKPEAAALLRRRMPRQVFLVPGFGAQGGSVEGVLPCFNEDGTGAVVTASRSVIYAFDADDAGWVDAISDAAARLAEEVGRAVGLR